MRTQVLLTDSPLDIAAVIAAAEDPAAGAVVSFLGTVRSTSSVEDVDPSGVIALFYDAHPSLAEKRMKEIAEAAAERWTLIPAAISHRVGRCDVGEPTVAIACGSTHRSQAFESCRWIIEELKNSVPIWKCEIYEDGSSWIGMGS